MAGCAMLPRGNGEVVSTVKPVKSNSQFLQELERGTTGEELITWLYSEGTQSDRVRYRLHWSGLYPNPSVLEWDNEGERQSFREHIAEQIATLGVADLVSLWVIAARFNEDDAE